MDEQIDGRTDISNRGLVSLLLTCSKIIQFDICIKDFFLRNIVKIMKKISEDF